MAYKFPRPALFWTLGLLLGIFSGCHRSSSPLPAFFLDRAGMDTTIDPGENFFLYANGNWLRHTPIPPTESGWGSYYILRGNSLAHMRYLLDSVSSLPPRSKGSLYTKVGDLYFSAMDTARINQEGIQPLAPELNRIRHIRDPKQIIDEVCREYREGAGTLFRFYGAPDARNSAWQLAHFDQGGLGLPSRDYYLSKDSLSQQIRREYAGYIAQLLSLSGMDTLNPVRASAGVLDLEYSLARISSSLQQLRDPIKNYHRYLVRELGQQEPALEWPSMLKELGLQQDTLLIGQPGFFRGLNKILDSIPLKSWKDYLAFHLVNRYAPYLSRPFAAVSFSFFGRALNGQQDQGPRWKQMSYLVDRELGDGLGQLYVQKFFPPEARQRMLDLVNNLQKTLEERIRTLGWMSDSTRNKALMKLNALVKKIGYPSRWKNYASLDIRKDSLIRNIQACDRYAYRRMIARIGKAVDRSKWAMTPPTVNAYYNPLFNEIVLPAGILQPPYFYPLGDDAVNYGGIGMIIGHEMTHGFDDQGRLYDARGNLRNWWTPRDSARFVQKTLRVKEQYNHSLVLDSLPVNGSLTLGEDIADIGGLALAYAAFKNTPEEKSGQPIDGLTPDQRFFLAFAQIWRVKTTEKATRLMLHTDPHAPVMYRVDNPLSNLEAFYRTYQVKPGDRMYRPDSMRIRIW